MHIFNIPETFKPASPADVENQAIATLFRNPLYKGTIDRLLADFNDEWDGDALGKNVVLKYLEGDLEACAEDLSALSSFIEYARGNVALQIGESTVALGEPISMENIRAMDAVHHRLSTSRLMLMSVLADHDRRMHDARSALLFDVRHEVTVDELWSMQDAEYLALSAESIHYVLKALQRDADKRKFASRIVSVYSRALHCTKGEVLRQLPNEIFRYETHTLDLELWRSAVQYVQEKCQPSLLQKGQMTEEQIERIDLGDVAKALALPIGELVKRLTEYSSVAERKRFYIAAMSLVQCGDEDLYTWFNDRITSADGIRKGGTHSNNAWQRFLEKIVERLPKSSNEAKEPI